MLFVASASIGGSIAERVSKQNVDKFKDISGSKVEIEEEFGWFEDFEFSVSPASQDIILEDSFRCNPINAKKSFELLNRVASLPCPPFGPPLYVLESSLSCQRLWYETAGRRPRQPTGEREYFEELWSKNFEASKANPAEDIVNGLTPQRVYTETNETRGLLYRGKGPYSTTVSKTFNEGHLSTVTLQMPHFRVVEDHLGRARAQFLVTVSINNVKFGVWRSYSHFKKLAKEVRRMKPVHCHTLMSWRCVVRQLRWFRCLDKKYLALKIYLLERFMQDFLFESESPCVIYEFLGLFD